MIKIPSEYKNLNYKHLKIIAMLVDSEINKPIENKQRKRLALPPILNFHPLI